MSLKTWAIISSDKIKLLLICIPSHWCPSALSHVTQLRTPENICHAFQKCIYSTVTFEEILWRHFVKIQMKQERNFPMTVVLGGVWGRVLLVCFLAPVWPHTRDSHQNNLQKQSNCKETVPRWRGAIIASVQVQVESTKKNTEPPDTTQSWEKKPCKKNKQKMERSLRIWPENHGIWFAEYQTRSVVVCRQ